MPDTCKTCRFWSACSCLRRAPSLGDTGMGRFPAMMPDDWCGEHEKPASITWLSKGWPSDELVHPGVDGMRVTSMGPVYSVEDPPPDDN